MTVTASAFASSGTTVGNGGNSIVCKNTSGQIASVEILDFFEARTNGLLLKLNDRLPDFKSILIENLNRWQSIAPQRVEQYKKWLTEFESETLFVSGANIPSIPDTGSVILPAGCELHPIAFQRPNSEIYPGVKRYTISKDLWDLMDEVQRAGLVMHELIYREGILAEHMTSFPTRYFNGYLATAEPNAETYAFIVLRLPLLWTEVSGMTIEKYTTTGTSKIYENGNLNAFIYKFYADVLTPNFSIINGNKNYQDNTLRIIYDGLNFSLGGNSSWTADIIKVKSERYNLQFIMNGRDFLTDFNINIDLAKRSWPWISLGLPHYDNRRYINMNEPEKNWLITKNSQRISNISTLKFGHPTNSSLSNYATEITTTTGEKWIWDINQYDYIKTK